MQDLCKILFSLRFKLIFFIHNVIHNLEIQEFYIDIIIRIFYVLFQFCILFFVQKY